jgi:hypothetical protein
MMTVTVTRAGPDRAASLRRSAFTPVQLGIMMGRAVGSDRYGTGQLFDMSAGIICNPRPGLQTS